MNILPWLRNPRKFFTASRRDRKGCGCAVFVPAGYEGLYEKNWPDTEVLEEEDVEEVAGKYRNCTKYKQFKRFRLKCTRCGTVYRTRRHEHTRVSYSEENPEKALELEQSVQTAPLLGGRIIEDEKPVIEEEGEEDGSSD